MPYNPEMYAPTWNYPALFQNQQTSQVNGLVYINDVDGAKSYQMPPNSVSPPLMLNLLAG